MPRFRRCYNSNTCISWGTVALMVLGQFSDICGFHPIKNFRNCAVKMLRRLFANFCHEIGCENDQTYIFCFVKYLSTFFYTYLPVNIHFQHIITNVSIYFNWSRLLRSAILSLWYFRFEVTWLLRDHFNSKTCVRFDYMKNLKMLNESSPQLE